MAEMVNTPRQQEIINGIDAQRKALKQVQRVKEINVWLNLAFYLGKQYVMPMTQMIGADYVKVLKEKRRPTWRVQLVVNRIFGIVQTRLAKMLKNEPRAVFTPAGENSEKDICTASAAQQIWDFLANPLKMNMAGKNEEAWLWAIIGGTSYFHPFWNTEMGEAVGQGKFRGDVDVEVMSPMELMIDPTDRTFEMNSARWAMRSEIVPAGELEETFNRKVRGTDKNPWNTMEYTLFNLMKGDLPIDFKAQEGMEYTSMHTYWEIPRKRNDWKGRHLIYGGQENVMLWESKDGFDEYRVPFYRVIDVRIPGRPEGESIVTQCRPVQKELNKTHSGLIEHRERLLKGKILVPKECNVNPKAFTDEPGERVEYTARSGYKPIIERPPELAVSYFKIIEYLIQELRETSGQHEVSHAQIPPGVRSGRAIWFLQEQDDTRLGPSHKRFHQSLGRTALHCIRLARDNYGEKRAIRVVGDYHVVDIKHLSKADLTGEIDVIVEPGTLLSTYKSAQQDLLLELWDRGVIKDSNRLLRMLEMGKNADLSEVEFAEKQALSETMDWRMGKAVKVIPQKYEIHSEHLRVHNRYRNSSDWDETSPPIQRIVNAHCKVHEYFMQQEAQAALQLQQLAGGQGGQGGQPRKR